MQIVSVRRNRYLVPCLLVVHVSLIQPQTLEVGICYTATQWALTFPNLRRHLLQKLAKSASILHYTSRFVPVAKEFLCVMCSFSTDSNQSISTSEPNLFGGFRTLVRQSICTSVLLRGPFSQRYLQTGPLTLCAVLTCLRDFF